MNGLKLITSLLVIMVIGVSSYVDAQEQRRNVGEHTIVMSDEWGPIQRMENGMYLATHKHYTERVYTFSFVPAGRIGGGLQGALNHYLNQLRRNSSVEIKGHDRLDNNNAIILTDVSYGENEIQMQLHMIRILSGGNGSFSLGHIHSTISFTGLEAGDEMVRELVNISNSARRR